MDVVIIGAGGFGREVLDVLRSLEQSSDARHTFAGFVDDGCPDPALLERLGTRHVGGTEILSGLSGCGYVVGVADARTRARLAAVADRAGLTPVTLVHPSATVGGDTTLGAGTVLCAGVRVTTHVSIGRHVHLNLNVTVGHDAVIEEFVTVNPLAAISGGVRLERGVTVGTTASVNQNVAVRSFATIGAGAAVIREVSERSVVVGVPARPL